MTKHTQTIHRQIAIFAIGKFDHFAGLALKGLRGLGIDCQFLFSG